MPEIPEPGEPGELKSLPGFQIATITNDPSSEESEVKPMSISFSSYLNEYCGIEGGMDKENGATALKIIKDIGVYFVTKENFLRHCSRAQIIYVARDGEYGGLYKSLGEDQEIYEIKFQHENKGVDLRIFFYIIPSERIFYIRGILHHHLDVTKSKRRR